MVLTAAASPPRSSGTTPGCCPDQETGRPRETTPAPIEPVGARLSMDGTCCLDALLRRGPPTCRRRRNPKLAAQFPDQGGMIGDTVGVGVMPGGLRQGQLNLALNADVPSGRTVATKPSCSCSTACRISGEAIPVRNVLVVVDASG